VILCQVVKDLIADVPRSIGQEEAIFRTPEESGRIAMNKFDRSSRRLGALFIVAAATCASAVWADSGTNHQTIQTWPIQMGTSGGNINDISRRYCCSGTLGAVVKDSSGALYILSNNHILARTNAGQVGDDISQPGMIDQDCAQNGILASLSAFVPIQFKSKKLIPLNSVDAAIALGDAGSLPTNGAILDIGTISPNTRVASPGLAVQKSGRTTGWTNGNVVAINVTVDVGYSASCGGPGTQVARFTNQISVSPGTFSDGGDSGSLILESGSVDPANGRPRAVGLLFAGSSSVTFANPINSVLSSLGVSMVGAPAAKSTSEKTSSTSAASGKGNGPSLNDVRITKARHSNELFGIGGVKGHGISVSKSGENIIQVYIEIDSPSVRAKIPQKLDNVPVEVVVTGPITAY
jgi:hypothetical protein